MLHHNLSLQTRLVSIALFSISLTQLCYCTESSCEYSAGTLLMGWAGLYMGGPMLVWLANPLLFISWLTVKHYPYASLAFSVMAALTSLSFLLFTTIYNHNDEWTSSITRYGSGYWLWLASCWSMVTGNVIVFRRAQNFA